jgi:DNA-binding transcriptional LysR family regulator
LLYQSRFGYWAFTIAQIHHAQPFMSPPTLSANTGSGTGRGSSQALPDLRALEVFVTVCESGSMVLAAQRLGITQSAVSQLVRVLEANYGVTLFDREVRPAQPTRAGKLLLEMADGLLSSARAVSEKLRTAVRLDHAQLRLGCVDSFAATVGPALVHALSGSARQLQLWSGLTPGLNKQLLARELDLAICTEVPQDDPRITGRLLFSESWVAVFPRGAAPQPLAEARALKDAGTAGLPLIRYSQRSLIGQQVERFLRHLGMDAPRRFEFDATDPMLSLVAAGLGWAISTPLCLWQSRAWLGDVDLLAIPGAGLSRRDFYLLCREEEWSLMADDISRITRTALSHDTLPRIHAAMPLLAADAIVITEPAIPSTP